MGTCIYCFDDNGNFEFINNLTIIEAIHQYLNDIYIPDALNLVGTGFYEHSIVNKKFSEVPSLQKFLFENSVIPVYCFTKCDEYTKVYIKGVYGDKK